MCGIVGYIGKKDAYPILIKGLHRLEYRGYDSAGVALISDNSDLNIYKSRGKVVELERFAQSQDVSGHIGIAHTRWATHGEPNDINAHPHYSESKNLAIIHNGIIENYTVLKDALTANGYTFKSDTDSEVIIQLIEYIQNTNNCSLLEAVRQAFKELVGAYSIAIIEKGNKSRIIAGKKSSPLVVGIGDGEYFLASDATPIVEYTDKVVYLNNDEIADISLESGLKVVDIDNNESSIDIKQLQMSISELEKGGYPHFMIKEIFEQPKTILDAIRGRVNVKMTNVVLSGVIDNEKKFLNAKRIIIVACGTSWHAGLIGEYFIEDMCRIPVEVEYASEFRYRNPIIYDDDIVIAMSQSGETADTLAAVELARSKGAFIFGICNVVGSSISRATNSGAYIHVGPEIGVASTKAFTGQVTVLMMLALALGNQKGTISQEFYLDKIRHLGKLSKQIADTLKLDSQIADLAKIFTYARNFLYLGRGYSYPVALEGALKLKEISYIHAEGYQIAEMKHGPIALIDSEMPVVVIAVANRNHEKTISNIQEIKARGGKIIAIINPDDDIVRKIADYVIEVPQTCEELSLILASIPLQLLAYYIAVYKGKDVDHPRNLAKSVTVE